MALKVAAHVAQAEAFAKFRKTETDLNKLESALAALSQRPSETHLAQLAQFFGLHYSSISRIVAKDRKARQPPGAGNASEQMSK